MDDIKKVTRIFQDFIEFFIIKYKYDQRGVLKRYRLKSGLNKQLNEETWCNMFLKKAAYNYSAKLLLIKYWEDNGKVASKINKEGLKKWNMLVDNINHHYGKLYELSECDIKEDEDLRIPFKSNDYDLYKLDDELAGFIIERLKNYNLKNNNFDKIYDIFSSLYTDEKRFGLNLEYFYKPANAIDYILSIKEKKESLL